MTALDTHVHEWVPASQPGAPTLLLLHGTGGDERDLLALGRMLDSGAALLSPRGNVLENGAPRFFRRLAEGVFDVPDLHRRTAALGDWLDAAASAYEFSAHRVFAVGFSNGANIAASLMFARPAALAGGILLRAMVPFEPDPLPDLRGRSVLLSEGRADPIIPAAEGERLAELFRRAGASVELAWQQGGHGLGSADVSTARRWLAEQDAAASR